MSTEDDLIKAFHESKKIYLPFDTFDPLGVCIECDSGKVSDGYYTFDELYEHRCLLFCMVAQLAADFDSWKSWKHADGSSYEGWFVAGIELGSGRITYHLPARFWDLFGTKLTREPDTAPIHDGHTSQDVLRRIEEFLKI